MAGNLETGEFPVKQYRNINMSTTGAVLKAAKGQVFFWVLCNNAATARFVKFYDKATAATASDTPVMTVELPATSTSPLAISQGIEFLTGISVRATNLVADNDNTAPSTNDVVVNVGWL
jgi:hypothetical protein